MREITLPTEYEVGQGYGKVAWDVRAIWENYSGWFHHRSTTELYPVGFDAVTADVVELGRRRRARGSGAGTPRCGSPTARHPPRRAGPPRPSRRARSAEGSPRKTLGRHDEFLGKSLAHRTNRENQGSLLVVLQRGVGSCFSTSLRCQSRTPRLARSGRGSCRHRAQTSARSPAGQFVVRNCSSRSLTTSGCSCWTQCPAPSTNRHIRMSVHPTPCIASTAPGD